MSLGKHKYRFEVLDLDVLPNDLKIEVLCQLDQLSLVRVRLVSKKWKELADNEKVWQSLFHRTFGNIDKLPGVKWKEIYRAIAGLHWDPIVSCDQIQISEQGTTATDICRPTSTYKWTTALAMPPIAKGKFYCEIQVDRLCDSSENTIKAAFGLIDKPPHDLLYNCPFGYSIGGFSRPELDSHCCCYMGDGNFMLNSKQTPFIGTTWTQGVLVGMLVDSSAKSVQYYMNGTEQGFPLDLDYDGDLFVAISLISGNQVTLIRSAMYPPGTKKS